METEADTRKLIPKGEEESVHEKSVGQSLGAHVKPENKIIQTDDGVKNLQALIATTQDEKILLSPKIVGIGGEETCKISEHCQTETEEASLQIVEKMSEEKNHVRKEEILPKTDDKGNEIMEETRGEEKRNPDNDIVAREKISDQHVLASSIERNLNDVEGANDSPKNDEGKMYDESDSRLGKEILVHTPDQTLDSSKKDDETVLETSNKNDLMLSAAEDEESHQSSNSAGQETDPEAVKSSGTVGNGQDEKERVMHDDAKDGLRSTPVVIPDNQNGDDSNSLIRENVEKESYNQYLSLVVDKSCKDAADESSTHESKLTEDSRLKENSHTASNDNGQDKDYQNHEREIETSFMDYDSPKSIGEKLATREASNEKKDSTDTAAGLSEGNTISTESVNDVSESTEDSRKVDIEKLEESSSMISPNIDTSASGDYAEKVSWITDELPWASHEENLEGKLKEDTPNFTDAFDEIRIPEEKNMSLIEGNIKTGGAEDVENNVGESKGEENARRTAEGSKKTETLLDSRNEVPIEKTHDDDNQSEKTEAENETAKASESLYFEMNQTVESPKEAFDTSSEKEVESLPNESGPTPTNEIHSTTLTGENSLTIGAVEVKERNATEISKGDQSSNENMVKNEDQEERVMHDDVTDGLTSTPVAIPDTKKGDESNREINESIKKELYTPSLSLKVNKSSIHESESDKDSSLKEDSYTASDDNEQDKDYINHEQEAEASFMEHDSPKRIVEMLVTRESLKENNNNTEPDAELLEVKTIRTKIIHNVNELTDGNKQLETEKFEDFSSMISPDIDTSASSEYAKKVTCIIDELPSTSHEENLEKLKEEMPTYTTDFNENEIPEEKNIPVTEGSGKTEGADDINNKAKESKGEENTGWTSEGSNREDPIEKIEDDEKQTEKINTEDAAESSETFDFETNQTFESPKEVLDTSTDKKGESFPDDSNSSPTKEICSTILTEEYSLSLTTGEIEAKERNAIETSTSSQSSNENLVENDNEKEIVMHDDVKEVLASTPVEIPDTPSLSLTTDNSSTHESELEEDSSLKEDSYTAYDDNEQDEDYKNQEQTIETSFIEHETPKTIVEKLATKEVSEEHKDETESTSELSEGNTISTEIIDNNISLTERNGKTGDAEDDLNNARESKGEENIGQTAKGSKITETFPDCNDEVPVEKIQDDEKPTEKTNAKTETAEPRETYDFETNQTFERHEEAFDTSIEKEVKSLSDENSRTSTKEIYFTTLTESESLITEEVEVKERNANETSKGDQSSNENLVENEDEKEKVMHDDIKDGLTSMPVVDYVSEPTSDGINLESEKLADSSTAISPDIDTSASSEYAEKVTCIIDGLRSTNREEKLEEQLKEDTQNYTTAFNEKIIPEEKDISLTAGNGRTGGADVENKAEESKDDENTVWASEGSKREHTIEKIQDDEKQTEKTKVEDETAESSEAFDFETNQTSESPKQAFNTLIEKEDRSLPDKEIHSNILAEENVTSAVQDKVPNTGGEEETEVATSGYHLKECLTASLEYKLLPNKAGDGTYKTPSEGEVLHETTRTPTEEYIYGPDKKLKNATELVSDTETHLERCNENKYHIQNKESESQTTGKVKTKLEVEEDIKEEQVDYETTTSVILSAMVHEGLDNADEVEDTTEKLHDRIPTKEIKNNEHIGEPDGNCDNLTVEKSDRLLTHVQQHVQESSRSVANPDADEYRKTEMVFDAATQLKDHTTKESDEGKNLTVQRLEVDAIMEVEEDSTIVALYKSQDSKAVSTEESNDDKTSSSGTLTERIQNPDHKMSLEEQKERSINSDLKIEEEKLKEEEILENESEGSTYVVKKKHLEIFIEEKTDPDYTSFVQILEETNFQKEETGKHEAVSERLLAHSTLPEEAPNAQRDEEEEANEVTTAEYISLRGSNTIKSAEGVFLQDEESRDIEVFERNVMNADQTLQEDNHHQASSSTLPSKDMEQRAEIIVEKTEVTNMPENENQDFCFARNEIDDTSLQQEGPKYFEAVVVDEAKYLQEEELEDLDVPLKNDANDADHSLPRRYSEDQLETLSSALLSADQETVLKEIKNEKTKEEIMEEYDNQQQITLAATETEDKSQQKEELEEHVAAKDDGVKCLLEEEPVVCKEELKEQRAETIVKKTEETSIPEDENQDYYFSRNEIDETSLQQEEPKLFEAVLVDEVKYLQEAEVKDLEVPVKNDANNADQSHPKRKSEDQLSSALPSEDQEERPTTVLKEIEKEKAKGVNMAEYDNQHRTFSAIETEDVCKQKKEPTEHVSTKDDGGICLQDEEPEEFNKSEIDEHTLNQPHQAEKLDDKLQESSSTLPLEQEQNKATNLEKIEYTTMQETESQRDSFAAKRPEELCFQAGEPRDREFPKNDENTADQPLSADDSDGNLQISASPSEEEGQRSTSMIERRDSKQTEKESMPEHESQEEEEDLFAIKTEKELILQKEKMKYAEDNNEDEDICLQEEDHRELEFSNKHGCCTDQALPIEIPDEQVQDTSSTLPSQESGHIIVAVLEKTENEKLEEVNEVKIENQVNYPAAKEAVEICLQKRELDDVQSVKQQEMICSQEEEEPRGFEIPSQTNKNTDQTLQSDQLQPPYSAANETVEICLQKRELEDVQSVKQQEMICSEAEEEPRGFEISSQMDKNTDQNLQPEQSDKLQPPSSAMFSEKSEQATTIMEKMQEKIEEAGMPPNESKQYSFAAKPTDEESEISLLEEEHEESEIAKKDDDNNAGQTLQKENSEVKHQILSSEEREKMETKKTEDSKNPQPTDIVVTNKDESTVDRTLQTVKTEEKLDILSSELFAGELEVLEIDIKEDGKVLENKTQEDELSLPTRHQKDQIQVEEHPKEEIYEVVDTTISINQYEKKFFAEKEEMGLGNQNKDQNLLEDTAVWNADQYLTENEAEKREGFPDEVKDEKIQYSVKRINLEGQDAETNFGYDIKKDTTTNDEESSLRNSQKEGNHAFVEATELKTSTAVDTIENVKKRENLRMPEYTDRKETDQDSFAAKPTEDVCLQIEQKDVQAVKEDEEISLHEEETRNIEIDKKEDYSLGKILQEERTEESLKVLSSALPSKEQEIPDAEKMPENSTIQVFLSNKHAEEIQLQIEEPNDLKTVVEYENQSETKKSTPNEVSHEEIMKNTDVAEISHPTDLYEEVAKESHKKVELQAEEHSREEIYEMVDTSAIEKKYEDSFAAKETEELCFEQENLQAGVEERDKSFREKEDRDLNVSKKDDSDTADPTFLEEKSEKNQPSSSAFPSEEANIPKSQQYSFAAKHTPQQEGLKDVGLVKEDEKISLQEEEPRDVEVAKKEEDTVSQTPQAEKTEEKLNISSSEKEELTTASTVQKIEMNESEDGEIIETSTREDSSTVNQTEEICLQMEESLQRVKENENQSGNSFNVMVNDGQSEEITEKKEVAETSLQTSLYEAITEERDELKAEKYPIAEIYNKATTNESKQEEKLSAEKSGFGNKNNEQTLLEETAVGNANHVSTGNVAANREGLQDECKHEEIQYSGKNIDLEDRKSEANFGHAITDDSAKREEDSRQGTSAFVEPNETVKDIQQLDLDLPAITEKHLPKETNQIKSNETIASTEQEYVQLTNIKKEHANVTKVEYEETKIDESTSIDSAKASPSELFQSSKEEASSQVAKYETVDVEQTNNKETPQNEEAEAKKTLSEKEENEEGDEPKESDSGSDAPIMVEASREVDVKASPSELLQSSKVETSQVAKYETEDIEQTNDNEKPQNEEAKTKKTLADTQENKDEGKVAEGNESKKGQSGSDAPIMVEASREVDVKASPSELLQSSEDETSQVAKYEHEDIEQTNDKKNLQNEDAETSKTLANKEENEDEVEVEEGDENEPKKSDSGSDAPIMVEASRDVDVKTSHKKSYNILSGVGSKVKQSISKVKKVITGKPSKTKAVSSSK